MSVGTGRLQGGISPPQQGGASHVLGDIYWNRAWRESPFAFAGGEPVEVWIVAREAGGVAGLATL
jgi:hypothetical protein